MNSGILTFLRNNWTKVDTVGKLKNHQAPQMSKSQKNLGQYFTISEDLQKFVFEKVKYKGSPLMEPSFGAGHLLKKFKELDPNYPMTCYELDTSIKPIIEFNEFQTVIYGDFTKQSVGKKFKTIVGNPPYVKQKTGNLFIRFIELCYECLDDDGELIFIVPSDFIKLTRASAIIDKMVANGIFTDFLFPNDEHLFEGANVDVVAFRYEKGSHVGKKTVVNGQEKFCNVNKGIITFSDTEIEGNSVDLHFHVYVGQVSGRDEIYRKEYGNIDLLMDKGKSDKFIFTQTFPTGNTQVDSHLLANKTALMERKIKSFTESNWFEWGAPRNLTSIQKYWGKPCIYVRTMTRNKEVAFIGNVQYFGGTLLCLIPRQEEENKLNTVISHMNSAEFQKNYMYAGRFKIGHKQISSAILPCLK